MTEVSIDTSVLLGLVDPKDVWHDAAKALKEALHVCRSRQPWRRSGLVSVSTRLLTASWPVNQRDRSSSCPADSLLTLSEIDPILSRECGL